MIIMLKYVNKIWDIVLDDMKEDRELYMKLFTIMEEKDFFKILPHMDEIYKSAGIS